MERVASYRDGEQTVAPLAAAIGLTAAVCAVGLLQAPPVWIGLVAIGLLVFAGSLVASEAKLYWLTIFLATIPLAITKLFYWTPDDVALIKRTYGIYINENMVPQMYLADLPLAMMLVTWLADRVANRRGITAPRGFLVAAAFMAWCLFTVSLER